MKGKTITLRNVGHGVNDLYWFLIPSMLPSILAQYELRYVGAGGILTAFLCVIAVFSFILGKVSDSSPRHLVMGAGFLFGSLFLVASTIPDSLAYFVMFILIAGIGVSAYHPAGYALLDETTGRGKGRAYGWFEFWGSLAVFCMFLIHGILLKELAWRPIIILTAVPGFIVGLLYMVFSARFSQSTGENPDSPSRGKTEGETRKQNAEGSPADLRVPVSGHIPLSIFVLFLTVITFRFFGIMAVVSFTPVYLVREVGLNPSLASYATGIYFLGGLIFTPILGRQCDLRGPFPVLLFTTGAAFPLIFLMSFTAGAQLFLPLYIFLVGICYYGAGPSMDMIITRISSRLGRGEAFGYFMAMIAIAYSFSPLLFGTLADRVGLRLSIRVFSFSLFASTAVLAALLLLMKRRTIPIGNLPAEPWGNPAGAGAEK
jgi:MFS family permease